MAPITTGAKAPLFTKSTFNGRTIDLSKMIRKKTWLCFYRYANCPICAHHIFEITQRYKKNHLDQIQVCAIFESERIKFGQLHDRQYPQFPLISDPGGVLYDLYGVQKQMTAVLHPSVLVKWIQAAFAGFFQGSIDGPISRVPAHFLIREDLTIHTAYYGKNIADHIPWETVESFLALPAIEVPETPEEKRAAQKTSIRG